MSPEERAAYLESLVKEGDAAWRKAIIDFLFNSSPKSHNFPRPGGRPGAPVHLLEDLNDKQTDLITEEKRLVENLQFLNAILSGESGIGGQKPTFHNSPQGGAEGESNPVEIPDDAPQPGGGAQAEARKKPKGPPLGGMPPGPGGRVPYAPLGMPPPEVPIKVTPPAPPEGIRSIANASGSSLVQLGLGSVKDKIFTTSQYLSDPAVRRAMGLQSYGATQNQNLVDTTYGFSTGGGGGGVVYKPEVPTWKPTLAHELGHVGRGVMRDSTAGIGAKHLSTLRDRSSTDHPRRGGSRGDHSRRGERGVAAASAGPQGRSKFERGGSHIARHRLSARKSSPWLHWRSLTLSAGAAAPRGHLGAKRSRHLRARGQV